jgi:hypothetical protein
MIAIEKNDESLVALLIHNIKNQKVLENQDINGRSAIHWVVWPFVFGSYENTKILEQLLRGKFKHDLKSKDGATPV